MPIFNGEKYACDSCVRGHRVSTCQHTDRELKLIPPKGRPVKQCEHCRTARKSKSHHGKCDCGSKKDKKDKEKSDAKDLGCCCHEGESCSCSTKSDAVEVRMERSLKRPTQAVKSKPVLSKSQSEDKLLHVVNGHHKPCHRNNNLAHTSGAPYKVPRPHSLHGMSSSSKSEDEVLNMFSAADDTLLRQSAFISSPNTLSRTSSADSLDDGQSAVPTTEEGFSYDFDKHFAPSTQFTQHVAILDKVPEETMTYSTSWPQAYSSEQSMNNFLGLSLDTSSVFQKDMGFQLFSPSDLPIISPQMSSYDQTISHSSDSANDSSWAGESLYAHGQSTGVETWTSADTTNALDSFLHGNSKYEAMSTAQARHLSSSSAVTAINLSTGPNSDNGGNALVIPADPDSPDNEAVDEWWPEPFVKIPLQPAGAVNYNWL